MLKNRVNGCHGNHAFFHTAYEFIFEDKNLCISGVTINDLALRSYPNTVLLIREIHVHVARYYMKVTHLMEHEKTHSYERCSAKRQTVVLTFSFGKCIELKCTSMFCV